MKKSYYITTPIYYPSDNLHIGHSYTTVAADAASRYRRLRGYDVMFLTGTDEHGQKIQRRAMEAGCSEKEYVDKIVKNIKDLWKILDVTNDRFIRTTDDYHEKTIQKIFQTLYDKGDIYKSEYEGLYCTPCESFWTEAQLEDNKCPDCGREVELTKEESYFFRLSKYQDRLIEHIEKNPDFIQPTTRKNEMLNNFLRPGLEDLCVSRTSFDWGVKVPFDEKHVVYVWVDALSNYITALGYGQEDDSDFKRYWPCDVHLVGKEIVRFHTIIWPALLMALDLPLPKQIFGHGWLLLDGGKMSKSKGNVVDPVVLVDKYGSDAIRYFLLREVPFGSDGLFSNESLLNRINSDLANDLGNLVSRTVAMEDQFFGGVMPEILENEDIDFEVRDMILALAAKVEDYLDKLQFSNALAEIWKCVSRLNKYIDETSPWLLIKEEDKKDRLAAVMYTLLESIRIISILLQPFIPKTPIKIWEQIGLDQDMTWDMAKEWGLYEKGTKVSRGKPLYPRIDVKKELEVLKKMIDSSKDEQEPVNIITIDEFARLEMKVCEVVEASKVEKSDKLLLLQLNLGNERRQVVSGIGDHYTAEELLGKKLICVTNLKATKIRGIESSGMILAASKGKKLALVTIDKDMPLGSIIS